MCRALHYILLTAEGAGSERSVQKKRNACNLMEYAGEILSNGDDAMAGGIGVISSGMMSYRDGEGVKIDE